MSITDPVGDTLIRIKNGYLASRKEVLVPHTKTNRAIIEILKKYDFIEDYKVSKKDPAMRVYLFSKDKQAFHDLKQISKPGRRKYVGAHAIPIVRNGFGISIVSTSQGIISGQEARKRNLGGELLAKIW